MNERLVEDWLSKASERAFQVPFAQALVAQGMEVLRVGHSAHEHGKDVIALDAKGAVRAYQLKDGQLDLHQWEEGFPQVVALVETPVEHPAIAKGKKHQPFLVVSGEISIPAADRIRGHNETWKKRGFAPLRTISGMQMQAMFNALASNFWPQKVEDTRNLLSLYLADGKGTLNRDAFATLIAGTSVPRGKQKADTIRRLAATNLFAAYSLSSFHDEANHWEIVQGWTITAAQIAWAADFEGLPKNSWHSSFRLAVDAAWDSLEALVNETLQDRALFPSESCEVDELTRCRCTICAGVLAIYLLSGRNADSSSNVDLARRELQKWIKGGRLMAWGESAVPFFMAVVWFLEKESAGLSSDLLLLNLLTALTNTIVGRESDEFASPYVSADEALARTFAAGFSGSKRLSRQAKASYTIDTLVSLVAKRLWRNALSGLWSEITKITKIELVPDHPRDLLLWNWKHLRGREDSSQFGTPESWKDLREESRRNENASLPDVLMTESDFALLFLLCFPHRFVRPFAKMLDNKH